MQKQQINPLIMRTPHKCKTRTQVRISEDIDFNHGMKKTCAWEINQLCKDMPHGHGRVIRCVLILSFICF